MNTRFYTPRRSLSRIVSIFVGLMAILVLLPGATGIWYSTQATRNVQAMRQAAAQSIQVSEVQLKWLAVVGALESLSVTRPTVENQVELASRLSELEIKLSSLSSARLGLSQENIAANQQITQDLVQTGVGLRRLSNEVYDLAARHRWSQSMNRRQAGLAELQKLLDQQLSQLNKNIESDLLARTLLVQRLRTQAGVLAAITGIAGVLFAIGLVWLSRRAIVRPMQQLTGDVERITRGDFSPVTPLARDDEIGELSRAIALMTDWLHDSYERMEQRVAERTQEVERRRVEIQVAAQVARDIASTRSLEALLNVAVNLICERLKFYHAGIFLNDDRGEFAVLRAATGEAGRALLARQHRLRIGISSGAAPDGAATSSGAVTGLVGYAAQSGEARVSLDVHLDDVHYRNPLLPDTRSEAAIPLKTGGRVIGVLDVQSTQPNAFDAESLQMLAVLADQLATAIQNARLLEELQQTLSELQTAYGQVDREAWVRFTGSRRVVGYQYDGAGLKPVTQAQPAAENPAALSIPLQVRDTQIGWLEVWSDTRDGGVPSTEEPFSEAEKLLLENISGRLSQVLESARLYEEAQRRAEREETINRLTASLARGLDMDGVLRSAAAQLGELPGVTEAMVLLTGGGTHDHRS